MRNTFTVSREDGREFTIRLVLYGDGYGRGRCIEHTTLTPILEIYDPQSKGMGFEPEGQIISAYYADTFLRVRGGLGLNLCGGVPEWTLDSKALSEAQAWLAGLWRPL